MRKLKLTEAILFSTMALLAAELYKITTISRNLILDKFT